MSGTILITLIMFGCIAAIIVLMVQSVKKQTRRKRQKLEDKLAQIIARRKLAISKKEQLRNRLIAVDADEQTLIHLWLENNEATFELLHCNNIKKNEVIKLSNRITETSSKGKSHVHEHVTAIQLQVTTDKNIFTIPFYNEVEDGILEMQELTKRAEEWRAYISDISSN